jgi:hypothetical protein
MGDFVKKRSVYFGLGRRDVGTSMSGSFEKQKSGSGLGPF